MVVDFVLVVVMDDVVVNLGDICCCCVDINYGDHLMSKMRICCVLLLLCRVTW